MFTARTALLSLVTLCVCASVHAEVLWWEAEDAKASNFPERHFFMPANDQERDKLSGGVWIGVDAEREQTIYAEYEVNVTKGGEYSFWARKFWKHGPFRWRFDRQAWQECGRDITLEDSVPLRTHVVANWVSLGKVKLNAGKHTLRIELTENEGAAAFDCFVLTNEGFTARGKMKPGQKFGNAMPGWFAFEPDVDPFTDAAAVDHRSLNQRRAGTDGFLKADGNQFVFSRTGEPVKFWALNASPHFDDHESVDYLARRLAKLGVNMVRVHGAIFAHDPKDPARVDYDTLNKIHYFVHAMANEGIYTKLSFYFPLWMDGRMLHEGYNQTENNRPFALLFFDPKFQAVYKNWAQKLLTTQNPYSGRPLADDPAVGIVEVLNEDNYFFWTFKPYDTIPADAMKILEAEYGRWLKRKYGSFDAVKRRWGDRSVRGDDFAAGRAGLYPAYNMTAAANPADNPRALDQVRFLTQHQRKFYEDMVKYFRGNLRVKCAMSATNWVTADNRILSPLDKYTNMACDVIDRHAYYGGKHEGEGASYSLRDGHVYADRTTMYDPAGQPVRELQYDGFPHIISEYNWPMPNRFRAECTVLSATYGTMQGNDGYFHFAIGTKDWMLQHSKFSMYTPVTMGQFPAASIIFRKGYIEEGPVVARNELDLEDLLNFKGSPVSQTQNLDALRAADIPEGGAGEVESPTAIDPLAFFVGQVVNVISDRPGKSMVRDLSPYIDREAGTVRSATDQLVWDYKQGLVRINAPKAQGAVGFLSKADEIRLDGMTIQTPMEYGAILAVSLDDKPLASSSKILVQVMSEDRNYGWRTSGGETKRIVSMGSPPINVKKMSGKVSLGVRDSQPRKVWSLDHNLYRKAQITTAADSPVTIDLEPDVLYYVIEK